MTTTATPYLSFPGTTREGFAFYAEALDATIETVLSYADLPAPPADGLGCGNGSPPPAGDGVMHASLALPGGDRIFAGDAPPGRPYDGIRGLMIALQFDTTDEARRVFGALSRGGQVTMPLAPAFWAETFGMLTDRFGVAWAVNGAPIPLGG